MSLWKCCSPFKNFGKRPQRGASGPESRRSSSFDAKEAEDLETAIALSLSAAKDTSLAQKLFEDSPERGTGPTTPRDTSNADDDDPIHVEKTLALKGIDEITANCIATNQPFLDIEFRPAPTSIYANGKCRRRDAQRLAIVQHYDTVEHVDWLTAGEIIQRPDDLQMQFANQMEMLATAHQFSRMVSWRVFQNDPDPTDISQGGLGNCWFCGSLAAVVEKPQLVQRLFVDSFSSKGQLSPQGVYLIRLCDGGHWKFVTIDGLLPCKQKMLAFSGARRNQLWVPLLEKAYSKLRGNYEAIEGGTPSEGLRLFTGWPSIVQELQLSEQQRTGSQRIDDREALQTMAICPYAGEDCLWSRLVSAYDSQLIICGSCGHVEGVSDDHYRSVGLSPSHCYSITQVATAKQGRLRLLRLRNPWGTGRKWTGRFSDKDTENWTDEIKAEIGPVDLGVEGIFWMTLEDIRKYFTSITICPYREGWAETRRLGIFPSRAISGNQPAFIINSAERSDSLLSLMQPEERASLSTMTADFGLVLYRLPRDGIPNSCHQIETIPQTFTLLNSVKRKVQDTLVCDPFLDGPILAVPLSFNQRAPSSGESTNICDKEFTFACFSSQPAVVRSISLSTRAYRDAVVAHIKKVGTQKSLFNGGVFMYQANDAGLSVYIENPTRSFLVCECHLTNVFNMSISRGMEATTQGEQYLDSIDTIPPMHAMIIFIAAAMPSGHNYSFQSSCKKSDDGAGDIHMPNLAEYDTFHTPFFLEGRPTVHTSLGGW